MKITAIFDALLILSVCLISCSKHPKTHLLVFSKTIGYRHESIRAGQDALTAMSKEKGFDITTTGDSKYFNDKELIRYTAVV